MKKITTITALILAFQASTALAASHFKSGMIRDYDLNGDSRVTLEEYTTVRHARFAGTDQNADGMISPAEYQNEFEGRLEGMLKASETRKVQTAIDEFRDLDANRDYILTRTEFITASNQQFTNFDKDKDGFLSKEEDKSPHSFSLNLLKLYDTNGDNKVSLSEYQQVKEAYFDASDTSKNGTLSQIEFTLMAEKTALTETKSARDGQVKQTHIRFDAIDTDKDKIMSWAEYEASGLRMFERLDTNKDGVLDSTDPEPVERTTDTTANTDKAGTNGQSD